MARRVLQERGGVTALQQELEKAGFVDPDAKLTTTAKPFNPFARMAAGVMSQPDMEKEQLGLGTFDARFQVCKNLPENDEQWASDDPHWIGKASMSYRHRFLTTKDLHWKWFNPLVFGLVDGDLAAAIAFLKDLRCAAVTYTRSMGWSNQLGLYFHVFGHNSVNSLHLHMVDLSQVGPTFNHLAYKNCSLEAVIAVISEELDARRPNPNIGEVEPFKLNSSISAPDEYDWEIDDVDCCGWSTCGKPIRLSIDWTTSAIAYARGLSPTLRPMVEECLCSKFAL